MKSPLFLVGATAALPLAAAVATPPAPPTASARPAAFARCAGCHAVAKGAPSMAGPNLWGVAGAKAASRPGWSYSPALKASKVTWTAANLQRYIANPQAVAPGTTMPNPGVTKPADQAAIAAWLATLK